MTYDLYPDVQHISPHTALYNSSFTVMKGIEAWLSSVPADKLVMGIAAYGRSFALSSGQTSIGSTCMGQGLAGPFTAERGLLAYYEIMQMIQQNSRFISVHDSSTETMYGYDDKTWVGFDSPATLMKKIDYAVLMNISGVMVWSLDLDDFNQV